MTWEWGSKYFTYGKQFGWRFQLYVWFRNVFFRPRYIELDLEGKRTDLFWRRFAWRTKERLDGPMGQQLVENFFKDSPVLKYLKAESAQDTALSPVSSNAGGSKQETTTITH